QAGMVQRTGDCEIKSLVERKIPAAAAEALGFGRKTRAIGALVRPIQLIVGRRQNLRFTSPLEKRRQLRGFEPSRFGRKRVTANGAAVTFIEPPPTPATRRIILGLKRIQ